MALDHRRLTGARLLIALAQSAEMPRQAAEDLFDACAHLPKDFDVTTLRCKNAVPIPIQHLGRSDSTRPQGRDKPSRKPRQNILDRSCR
jgi:hypothetical protein